MNPFNFTARILYVLTAALMLQACNKEDDEPFDLTTLQNNNIASAQLMDVNTISSDMKLEDRAAGVDYIFSKNVVVSAKLTVEPGTTVMFDEGAGMIVTEQGSLTAEGTSAKTITFTSKAGKRGSWKSLTFLSNNSRNVLSYCKVEQGGADNGYGSANVVIGTDNNVSRAEISNCQITASAADGIVLAHGSQLLNFKANNIHTNSRMPISMNIADADKLDNSNTFSNNGKEYIGLSADDGKVQTPIALKYLEEPFLLMGEITAGNSITISSGARIYLDENAQMNVEGSMTAVGNPSQEITIAALYNRAGVWGALQFSAKSAATSRLEYCRISGGGAEVNGKKPGMISVLNGGYSSSLTIRNCTLINSATAAIYINDKDCNYNNDITTANTFVNNTEGNVVVQ